MKATLKNILLVEDDDYDARFTIKVLLDNNLSNKIDRVTDGEQAMDYLHRKNAYSDRDEGNPALILLDIKMPKVSGLDVLREIRSDHLLKYIPVVILTASRAEKDLIESYRLGVNAYVVKPVDIQQFIGAIKQLGVFWSIYNEPPPRLFD